MVSLYMDHHVPSAITADVLSRKVEALAKSHTVDRIDQENRKSSSSSRPIP